MIKWLVSLFRNQSAPAALSTGESTRTDTEFTAEIVRVTQITPHSNAERLEIARFEMKGLGETSYEVVVQKGSAQPGDLMAYFSVDCILPLDHPDFQFLASRLDGVGKTHYRLRAARLRGVFSQGLLVPSGNFLQYGDNVAALFRVAYYQAPEPRVNLGNGQLAKPVRVQPIPVYSVDSLKKMPRLFQEGEQVCITEKIHGTNFRFGWVRRKFLGVPLGWRFVVGSHRVVKNPGILGESKSGGHWYGTDIWCMAAKKMGLAAKTKGHKGRIFYGELYGHTYSGERIQDLTYGQAPQEGPGLAIFDVKDLASGEWLASWEVFDTCLDLHLEHVPVLKACASWQEGLLELAGGVSTLDSKTVREGIVVEALNQSGPRRKAKFVSEAYLTHKGA